MNGSGSHQTYAAAAPLTRGMAQNTARAVIRLFSFAVFVTSLVTCPGTVRQQDVSHESLVWFRSSGPSI